jgi:hypothetical protein
LLGCVSLAYSFLRSSLKLQTTAMGSVVWCEVIWCPTVAMLGISTWDTVTQGSSSIRRRCCTLSFFRCSLCSMLSISMALKHAKGSRSSILSLLRVFYPQR